MSKMSQLHVELTEQASELGFESIYEAEQHGYTVKYSGTESFLVPDTDKELEKAHEAWLKEREEVVVGLERLITAYKGADGVTNPVRKAINFIMRGEI